jgi:hypothetical protein
MRARNVFLANTVSLELFEQILQRCECLCRRQSDRFFFGDDIGVETGTRAIFFRPIKFAKQPFDPIPGNRIPNPLGNSDAQA